MLSDLKFAAYYLPVFCFVNFSLEFFHRHIFIAGRLIPYRMESRYDFFYHLNDVRTVFVTCLCQFCQLSEEFTDIKRNWFADMDQPSASLRKASHQDVILNKRLEFPHPVHIQKV